jgi:spore germination protein Q
MDNNQQIYKYALPYTQGSAPQPYPPTPPQQQITPPNPSTQTPYQQPYSPYPYNPPKRFEESYIENIIRLNRGKLGTFYMTYSDSNEWRDRVYKGVIEAAGVDHIIISDPRDGKRYILLNIYLDWVEFNEEINYEYPLA